GRVNIIGEHTDYSYGYVMPIAINLYTIIDYEKSDKLVLYSEAYNETKEFDLANIKSKTNSWLDYIIGVYKVMHDMGLNPGPINGKISGNLPIGSGLSSSASLELAIAAALNHTYELKLDRLQMALIGKKAENEFVGVPSGILDQFAVSFGKKGYAIFLDTQTLKYQYIPFPDILQIIVFNTGIKRELANSEYANRKKIVEESLGILKKNSSKEINEKDLDKLPLLHKKRMGYIIRENQRVLMAMDCLKNHDYVSLGKILVEAHRDIATNYEVSSPELDFVVNEALKYGAYGARLTGAGFGGSAIILSGKENSEKIAKKVYQSYTKEFKYKASYTLVEASEGTYVL
ncbi:MAG: galactokinase, partial [Caldisphaera sp.]|nr:galactokinase [Caldisphaera sp.]